VAGWPAAAAEVLAAVPAGADSAGAASTGTSVTAIEADKRNRTEENIPDVLPAGPG
jgi:hypothetical protein